MSAPVCPVNRSQPTAKPFTRPALVPTPPIATDLPSAIRAVNIIDDILREITTSLTVNNTWEARPSPGTMIYDMSPYPEWQQSGGEREQGYIYYKYTEAGEKKMDYDQKAKVVRSHTVEFVNRSQTSFKGTEMFRWSYRKALDSPFDLGS